MHHVWVSRVDLSLVHLLLQMLFRKRNQCDHCVFIVPGRSLPLDVHIPWASLVQGSALRNGHEVLVDEEQLRHFLLNRSIVADESAMREVGPSFSTRGPLHRLRLVFAYSDHIAFLAAMKGGNAGLVHVY